MRTPFLAANWKMFKTVHEAVAFVKEFRGLVKDMTDVEIVVAPPFTALHAVAEAARVCRPGGLVAATPHRRPSSLLGRDLWARAPRLAPPGPQSPLRVSPLPREPEGRRPALVVSDRWRLPVA